MALTRPRASQLNTNTIDFADPLLRINKSQTGTNDKDIGVVFERGTDTNVAIIWDESADQFAVINTDETGSTAGDVTISSYANIKANAFYGDGSNLTGIASAYGDSDVAAYLSANGYGTSSSIIASITDSAPGTLDTLNELAAALGDDANFSTTVTNSIATKLSLTGGTVSGDVTLSDSADLVFQDNNGTFPTSSGGFFWDLNNDEARIYAEQPASDQIDFFFKISDNAGTTDRFVYWIDDYRGSTYDKYPAQFDGSTQYLGIPVDGSGNKDLANARFKVPYSGDVSIDGNKIWHAGNDGAGSGLDADTLDGVQGSGFLRSDANDTASGQLYFSSTYNRFNTGNSNNTSTADTNGLYLHTSSYTDGRYTTRFRKYDNGGGVPLYIDNSSGTANTFTATARFGTYSGNGYEFEVFGDIKANGNVDVTGVFNGTATSAQYADLAENYLADRAYPIGTVLEIGGDAEVTVAAQNSYRIVGTISEAPGYLMNSGLEGEHVVPVAYIGRVPCRVQGTVKRGDFLVVGDTPGVAVAKHPMNILMGTAIGKALEDYDSNEEGVIEILVGRL